MTFPSALLGILLAAASTVAAMPQDPRPASSAELSAAWKNYLKRESAVEPRMVFPYEDCFRIAADKHGLPRTLLLAVARGESNFDPRAVSHANAHGLMQILWPGTARHLGFGTKSELYDPCRNVAAGARYLRELLARYDGDLHLALAAYNYGPGRIRKGANKLPSGAVWYSDYIYNHLRYVLGTGASSPAEAPVRYVEEGQLELAVFTRPYRAAAFSQALRGLAPEVRLDWFRNELAQFRVVLLFTDEEELARSRTALRRAGYSVE